MSRFFPNNRPPSNPRKQKKHTATNCVNDRFTIYANLREDQIQQQR